MNAKCACNVCSGQIEFESASVGQTIACPHCGMDTILYASPAQPSTVRNKRDKSDETIYSQGNIKVLPTRLMIGSATYAIAAISSLRIVMIPASKLPLLFSILGLIFLPALTGIFFDLGSMGGHILSGLLFLFAVFLIVVAVKKMKPTYALCITTTAQEQQVLTSPTVEALHPVESALHQAISMRG